MQKLIFHIELDLYVYEEGKFRIFLQNSHFSANSIKTCNYIQTFQYFLVGHKSCVKKIQETRKKAFLRGIHFFWFDICMCQQKKMTPAISDWFWVCTKLLMHTVPFPLFSGYSLILRWKNLGDQKKSFYEVDLFFLNRYTSLLTKKMTAAISDLFWACTIFFSRHGTFFRFFLGGNKTFNKIPKMAILVNFHHGLSNTNKYWSESWEKI